jgi:hypothetical protein
MRRCLRAEELHVKDADLARRYSYSAFIVRVSRSRSLIELFESMDTDGSNSVEFEEFLAAIIHMGMGKC